MTLLEMVQSILSDMDSEDVNSIFDSVEATQVASIVKDTFYNLVSTKDIPEHHGLLKLTALADSEFPTHFLYPTNTKHIEAVWYKDSDGYYRPIEFIEPLAFLRKTDNISGNFDTVADKNGGTDLRIKNNADPTFYTSFDDKYIVMNSYDSDEDTTLQESKIRAYGVTIPVFSILDSYEPDIDNVLIPYLLAESKSTCMSVLKGTVDPKIDQASRRQKNFVQNDMYKTRRKNNWSTYGRS